MDTPHRAPASRIIVMDALAACGIPRARIRDCHLRSPDHHDEHSTVTLVLYPDETAAVARAAGLQQRIPQAQMDHDRIVATTADGRQVTIPWTDAPRRAHSD